MARYIACDNPEHDRFSHRKEDCTECTPQDPFPSFDELEETNPRIGSEVKVEGPLGLMYLKNLTSTQERCTELLEENRKLKSRIAELERGEW